MAGSAAALLAWGLLVHLAGGITAVQHLQRNTSELVIAGVHVNPANFEDYTRGHEPISLFTPGTVPGKRSSYFSPSLGVPSFNAANPTWTPEAFIHTPRTDPVGMLCSPGGKAYGHYFYNVRDPEVVPFIVPLDQPGRRDVAMVVAPGGGHLHLAWEPSGVGPAEWLNSIGISAFVLKYRVPDFNGAIQQMDLQRAISLARSQAAKYKLNASCIGFLGASASGGLGLRVATSQERLYPTIDDVDNLSFLPDFMFLLFPGDSGFMTPESAARMPPTFLTFAAQDPCVTPVQMHVLVKQMQIYAKKPFAYKEFAEGRHGWATCEYYPSTLMGMELCTWKQHAEAFLKKEVLHEA
mmetsp:Transcript_86427/g.201053  ORF Transcript_86427/g.201053 Transcript_86427/m.201053 type:complete len:352 (+) Transcript_86427:36-1091(+)